MTVQIPKLLIVGLGNLPYPATRHSVGQFIIDALSKRLGIPISSTTEGYIGEKDVMIGETLANVTLFKSKYLMNISGRSVAKILNKTVKKHESLVVISDSLSHPVGKLQVTKGGSAQGHNGVKSVLEALGIPDFHRIRVGIGRSDTVDTATYVLQKLSSYERQYWADEGLDSVVQGLEKILALNAGSEIARATKAKAKVKPPKTYADQPSSRCPCDVTNTPIVNRPSSG